MAKNLQIGLRQSMKTGREASLTGDGLFSLASLDLRFAQQKTLDPRITHTRASSATFVDSSGVLRSAVTNLCLQSENFTTTWTNFLSTDAANTAIAPNGTLTADTLIPDSGATAGLIRQDFSGATFTDNASISFSVYVKAAGLTDFNIQFYNKANTFQGGQTVNASTGALSGVGTLASTVVTSVGDGWYRVSMTGMSSGAGATGPNLRIVVTSTGNGTSGLFLWGAQLEQASTVGDYVPTTSTINSAPRFDHAITSSTTNLVLRSEEFNDASWAKDFTVATANQTTAPNGTVTADKVAEDTSTNFHAVSQYLAGFASGAVLTLSIYAKAAGRSLFRIQTDASGGSGAAEFNLSTVTATSGTGVFTAGSIQAVGDGWYRCSVRCTTSTAGAVGLKVVLGTTTVSSYTGDGTSGIFVWGAQLEQSATVGPYVPTTTAAATSNTTDSLGLLVEEARTNSITNNTMVGAVAGTPGTNPTGWAYASAQSNGLTLSIVGTGVENGINYIDYRFNGTTVASPNSCAIGFVNATAATGQTWTASTYWKLAAGSTTGITNWQLGLIENTAGGSFVTGAFYTQTAPTSAALITQRPAATRTLSGGGTVGLVTHPVNVTVSGNTAIDFTIRIGLPQLEQGAFATSVIPTTTATVTRAADVASITGSNFSSWYNQTEGTFFCSTFAPKGTVIYGTGDTFDNTQYVIVSSSGNVSIRSSNADSAIINAPVSTTGTTNIAHGYAANNFAAVSNGGTISTDTSGGVPLAQVRLKLGSSAWSPNAGNDINGHIKRLTFWPTRLSNEVLQRITQP